MNRLGTESQGHRTWTLGSEGAYRMGHGGWGEGAWEDGKGGICGGRREEHRRPEEGGIEGESGKRAGTLGDGEYWETAAQSIGSQEGGGWKGEAEKAGRCWRLMVGRIDRIGGGGSMW
jgi:hypothetical protein